MGQVEECRELIHGLFDGEHTGQYVATMGRWIKERDEESLPATTLPTTRADDGVLDRPVNPCCQAVPEAEGVQPLLRPQEGRAK